MGGRGRGKFGRGEGRGAGEKVVPPNVRDALTPLHTGELTVLPQTSDVV